MSLIVNISTTTSLPSIATFPFTVPLSKLKILLMPLECIQSKRKRLKKIFYLFVIGSCDLNFFAYNNGSGYGSLSLVKYPYPFPSHSTN
jgi:hypothetical protein